MLQRRTCFTLLVLKTLCWPRFVLINFDRCLCVFVQYLVCICLWISYSQRPGFLVIFSSAVVVLHIVVKSISYYYCNFFIAKEHWWSHQVAYWPWQIRGKHSQSYFPELWSIYSMVLQSGGLISLSGQWINCNKNWKFVMVIYSSPVISELKAPAKQSNIFFQHRVEWACLPV